MSQASLGRTVGISQTRQSDLETGRGSGIPVEVWFALSKALDLPLILRFARDAIEQVADAGHLPIQELVLRLTRAAGFMRRFELPVGPTDAALVVDVGLREGTRRALVVTECWNRFGSIGAAVRNTQRKVARLIELAETIGGEGPAYTVAACWVVRDTARNRELMRQYPEVFAAAFPGSSLVWLKALTVPAAPIPTEAGLVWCDTEATRLFAHRPARP